MELYKIRDIVMQIIESADELVSKESLDDVEYGTLLGYAEVLSIVRDEFADIGAEKAGIDFDIDEKYLL